jgi:hypothetical protein
MGPPAIPTTLLESLAFSQSAISFLYTAMACPDHSSQSEKIQEIVKHLSPSCDLCKADDDVQDEQHAVFHCTHPHTVSLRRRYEPLFSKARA